MANSHAFFYPGIDPGVCQLGQTFINETSGAWYFIWANKWYIHRCIRTGAGIFHDFYPETEKLAGIAGCVYYHIECFYHRQSTGKHGGGHCCESASIALMDKADHGENREWIISSWDFTKQIVPMLAIGVVIAGFLLGSTHDDTAIPGVIPNEWVAWLVGGNSVAANFFASIVGAFMYFATLTEVPILQGLLASGMGKGPALALLLAGPSLSLPNMLVIRGVMGTQKTLVYIGIVVVLSTIAGLIFGSL
jgi:uncharacterized protein